MKNFTYKTPPLVPKVNLVSEPEISASLDDLPLCENLLNNSFSSLESSHLFLRNISENNSLNESLEHKMSEPSLVKLPKSHHYIPSFMHHQIKDVVTKSAFNSNQKIRTPPAKELILFEASKMSGSINHKYNLSSFGLMAQNHENKPNLQQREIEQALEEFLCKICAIAPELTKLYDSSFKPIINFILRAIYTNENRQQIFYNLEQGIHFIAYVHSRGKQINLLASRMSDFAAALYFQFKYNFQEGEIYQETAEYVKAVEIGKNEILNKIIWNLNPFLLDGLNLVMLTKPYLTLEYLQKNCTTYNIAFCRDNNYNIIQLAYFVKGRWRWLTNFDLLIINDKINTSFICEFEESATSIVEHFKDKAIEADEKRYQLVIKKALLDPQFAWLHEFSKQRFGVQIDKSQNLYQGEEMFVLK